VKAKADTPLTPWHTCRDCDSNSRTADEMWPNKGPNFMMQEADRGQRIFASHVERREISVDRSLVP